MNKQDNTSLLCSKGFYSSLHEQAGPSITSVSCWRHHASHTHNNRPANGTNRHTLAQEAATAHTLSFSTTTMSTVAKCSKLKSLSFFQVFLVIQPVSASR